MCSVCAVEAVQDSLVSRAKFSHKRDPLQCKHSITLSWHNCGQSESPAEQPRREILRAFLTLRKILDLTAISFASTRSKRCEEEKSFLQLFCRADTTLQFPGTKCSASPPPPSEASCVSDTFKSQFALLLFMFSQPRLCSTATSDTATITKL